MRSGINAGAQHGDTGHRGIKGIGLAIARRFAGPGVDVFLNYRADGAAAERARIEIEATAARCHLIRDDVATPAGARTVVEAVEVGLRNGVLDHQPAAAREAPSVVVGAVRKHHRDRTTPACAIANRCAARQDCAKENGEVLL
jgi:hypothetical protein